MTIWRYGLPYRHPGSGSEMSLFPVVGRVGYDSTIGISPSGRRFWGYLDYDHRLTDEQTRYFNLELIGEVTQDESSY